MSNPVPAVAAPAAPVAPAVPANGAVKNGASPHVPQQPAEGVKPAASAAEEKFAVKINGKVEQLTRAELEKYAQKGRYAEGLIQKATLTARELQQAKEAHAKEIAAAKEARKAKYGGFDPDEDPEGFARFIAEKKIRENGMSPEQKRIAELEAREAEMRSKLEETQKTERQKQVDAQAGEYQKQIESKLVDAAKRQGLALDGDSFYAVFQALQDTMELGLPFDPDRIVETARENIEGGFARLEQSVLKGLKGEALLSRLGPAVTKAVLEARLEQIRNGKAGGAAAKPAQAVAPEPVRKPSQYLTPAQADAQFRKLGGGVR